MKEMEQPRVRRFTMRAETRSMERVGGPMDGNSKRWGSMLKRNNQLRSRVVTWKLMLLQLTDRQARPVPGLIAALQLLQQFLERDLFHSFALEEDGLYADTEDLQRRLV